ncbi:MAG TPA: C25 family cysteine peptidase [Lentimicrobium sp.]|nr:C25 family cysteine peptidase [Lentimicrobium sp.]
MKKQLPFISLNQKFLHLLIVVVLTLGTIAGYSTDYRYADNWGKQGLSIKSQSSQSINLNFSMQHFSISETDIDGVKMNNISFSESLLPNDEGNPDLPGFGRYIAIPQGATPVLEITNMRVEHLYNMEIAPAPRIPLDTEKGPLEYHKNPQVYTRNEFFPAQPVQLNAPTQIRGVDVCMLSILPYQYNPVTKELIIYRDIEINIRFEGGNRQFGENKYRNPYWDEILEDVIFNYESLPKIDYSKRDSNRLLETGYEYLIITPNDPIFVAWADSIKNFRNEEGILTGVVKLSEIGSNVSAVMLENYIDNIYETWDIPPAAILLLGDYGQANQNNNSIISPIWDSYCVSDNIYADVNEDDMPEIVFARITAQNETQLASMVGRFMKYERNPPTNPSFYQHPITALGWQTVRWFQICSETVGGFWKNVLGKEPVRINEVYEGSTNTWSTAANTGTILGVFASQGLGYIPDSPTTLGGWSGGNSTMINNALNAGAFMLMHRDHGEEIGWGEPRYITTNINALTNTDLSWILSINCLTGKYNWNSECFTEKFHRHTYNGQPAGALGLTAASETSYSFVNDVYVWGMMDNMWPNFMPQYGCTPASRGVNPAFGNAAGKFFLQQSSWPSNPGNKEVTYHLFHHHGDAFIRVCTEVPQNISATVPAEIYETDTQVTISTAENARVCISRYGEILDVKSTSMGSTIIMDIPPQSVGTVLTVTITKPNCNRLKRSITVVQAVTAAYAGEDATLCADQNVQLAGSGINYTNLLWETTGTGTFDNAAILNPVYTPGAEDLSAGNVILSLTASKSGMPDSTDYVTITFVAAPTAFAGNDVNICDGDGYSTSNATAANYTQLQWSTSGTGSFDDASSLSTRYSPSEEDNLAGNVVLTLTVSNETCEVQTSDVHITINPKPDVSISGVTEACQNQSGIIYSAGSTENTYEWQIAGGEITAGSNEHEITVTWIEHGTGSISLTETNQFGCFNTNVIEVALNAAPATVISGDNSVCANSTGVIYSTPLTEGNNYQWNIAGGTIVEGANSNEVTVNWGENGSGTVSVLETNALTCASNVDYPVAISSPVISLGADTTVCINHKFVLDVDPGFASYSWSTGETTPSIEVSGALIGIGNNVTYTVTVTDADGCQSVSSVTVTAEACAGLPENDLNYFSLYPNPNTGEFNILFGNKITGTTTVRITSATGKLMFTKVIDVNANGQIETFNITNLNRGVYFVSIASENESAVQKLIIR